MKRLKLLLVFVSALCSLFPVLLYSQVDTAWARIYNGPGNEADEARAIAVDGQGNVYVTGISRSANDDNDYATIKYNADGVEQWVRRYNGPGNDDDEANALAIDNQGNVYVTGFSYDSITSLDFATIKYNTNGDTVWVRRYSPPISNNDDARAIAVDGQGNVYVTGESYISGSTYDYVTIKYYANGDTAWVRRYNGPSNYYDFGFAICVDTLGNVYVTGLSSDSGSSFDYVTIKYNSDGDTLWLRRYNGPGSNDDWAHSITVDGQGNVYVTGESYGLSSRADYATIKYNSNGDTLWVRRYNGPGNNDDQAYAIAVDSQGNVYVTGESPDSGTFDDYATIKYNSSGTEQWVRRYDGPGGSLDKAYALALDGQGNVYVTGSSRGSSYVEDYATIKYNSNGDTVWVRRYNGPGNSTDNASAIAVDNAGNVYVTGASFSSGTYNDYATIKYVQTGAIEENREPLSTDRSSLEVYPNPAKSVLRVRVPVSVKTIKIFDVSGKLIKEVTTASPRNDEVKVSLNGINPGIFFLRLGTEIKKFLVVQ